MFKHILVPVDEAELPDRVIQAALSVALGSGASIMGFVVDRAARPAPRTPALRLVQSGGHGRASSQGCPDSEALARLAERAAQAGVEFDTLHLPATHSDQDVLRAARTSGCDLILMASDGQGAFGEFLFGSQTRAVLAQTELSLLIIKQPS